MENLVSKQFWAGKSVLLTGHTGFKGSWMSMVLRHLGAKVHGVSLPPEGPENLFTLLGVQNGMTSDLVDIRNRDSIQKIVATAKPDIVIHMAAQALVRKSFTDVYDTFDTNVMGTLALLDALAENRLDPVVLCITSDKVYRNDETGRAFAEGDALGGDDPYSASKAACEIAVHAFAKARHLRVATARAGNVVGGGDFAQDRILPDIIRALQTGRPLRLRNPDATRPWQHVLDVVTGYLAYAQKLATDFDVTPKALNFGPDADDDNLRVNEVLDIFGSEIGKTVPVELTPDATKPEKARLNLDTALVANTLGFQNRYRQRDAIRMAATWYRQYLGNHDARALVLSQIEAYGWGV